MKNIGEKSIGSLVDELITTRIKQHYRSLEKNQNSAEVQNLHCREAALVNVLDHRFQLAIPNNHTIGNLILELTEVLLQCWNAQERVMSEPGLEQVGLAAKEAQRFNAQRNELVRKLDACLGDQEISVTRKTYSTS